MNLVPQKWPFLFVLQSETHAARKQGWHVPLCNLCYCFQGVQGGKGEQGPAGPPGFQVSQPKRTDEGPVWLLWSGCPGVNHSAAVPHHTERAFRTEANRQRVRSCCVSQGPSLVPCHDLEGWGWGGRGRVAPGRADLCTLMAVSQHCQEPTQRCKATVLQLKIFKKNWSKEGYMCFKANFSVIPS